MVSLHSNMIVESEGEMSSAGRLHSQLSAIMSVLAKAAVAEIARLLEEEAAALHQEIRRRNEEIQGLKTRLMLTENRPQTDRCSIGVQVEITDTSVTAQWQEAQAAHHIQEKLVVKDLSEEEPQFSHPVDVKREESVLPLKDPEEEELSGLEFEMKIEQVEELVDQEEQKHEGHNHCNDGNAGAWCPGKAFEHQEAFLESELHSQDFTDPYVMMEDPSTQCGLLAVLENESFGAEYDLQDSHRSSTSDCTAFSASSLPKPSLYPGKHTGEKPFTQSPYAGKHTGEKPFTQSPYAGKHTGEKPFTQSPYAGKHTGEKPFNQSPYAGKHTGEKPFNQRPYPGKHTGEKPFNQRPYPGKHTGEKPFNQSPYPGKHTGEKPFNQSPYPGKHAGEKPFNQSPYAGKHAGEKPFRCQLCGKGFAQRTRLLTHRIVHTGEKPFRCEECGKGFTQRTRLITHRLVHTGEKPFRCQLCGKTFSRQDNCLRHVRLHSGQRS